MAAKRPAETVGQTSNKKAMIKISRPEQAWNEAQKALDMLDKQFQQKHAAFEECQKRKAAEIVQDQKPIAALVETMKRLFLRITAEKFERQGAEDRYVSLANATTKKLAESRSKHALQIRDLKAQLHQANVRGDGCAQLVSLKSVVAGMAHREKEFIEQAKVTGEQVRELRASLQACERRCTEATTLLEQTNVRNLAVMKKKDVHLQSLTTFQKRDQEQITELKEATSALTRKNGDFEGEIRDFTKKRACLKQKHAEGIGAMSQVLQAAVRVRDEASGMQFGNMGSFGAAHEKLRVAVTPKLRTLLRQYGPSDDDSDMSDA